MRHWLCISAALGLLLAHTAYSQVVERQVITPAGSSGVAGTTRITWTSGQIETQHLRTGQANITQGFQQPDIEIGYLQAGSFAALPGETGEAAITLTAPRGLIAASAISVRLRFNATLLEPLSTSPSGTIHADTIIDGKRILDLLLPTQPFGVSPMVLTTLRFKAGLGNDSVSALELIDAKPVGGPVAVRAFPGAFTLLGICRDGGPRLINPVGRTALALRPNPASTTLTLAFEVFTDGPVRAALVDMFGHEVRVFLDEQVSPGNYSLDVNVADVPSGAYTITLATPIQRVVQSLVIQH